METPETPISPGMPPAPHDSMVTVALSDIQSNSEHTQPDWRTLDIPQTPVHSNHPEFHRNPSTTSFGPEPLRDAARSTPIPMDDSPQTPTIPEETHSDDEIPKFNQVNWEDLEKTESEEPRSEDDSTALLLARLEQENNALAKNPKSAIPRINRHQRQSRSESLVQIKKLIHDPARPDLVYSQLAPPPMTELEFWAALVSDYHQTAQRLPTLTSNKIRGGIPPPLRGVVWPSLAGARDPHLFNEFERLSGESSPYDGLIGKDIGRSFPNVEMFRDPNGEGQRMLGRVLRCFSLYDSKIGYCQGLGFVVGPLLMHMSDAEAFAVLVRLMDHYNLRMCYLPDLSGLHLHVYQFQNLLARHRPALFEHLETLHVEPVYVSQWFLSFFAVTCPLPMLLRVYDVIFLEGACETLMRVALSLMQRNEKKILAFTEFEDVMQFLLSRSVWDIYAFNADDLVNDFVSLTSLVTQESLQTLEANYNQSQGVPTGISFPQMQATASGFLGRFWTGSSSHNSVKSLSPNPSVSRPNSTIRRSTSKQSMTSTLNSIESLSDTSTAPTELSPSPSVDSKSRIKSSMSSMSISQKDRDMHNQIEDLLMALTEIQRQHSDLTLELQQEREEREEDHAVAKEMLWSLLQLPADLHPTQTIMKAQTRFSSNEPKEITIPQTKHQLHGDMTRWKHMFEVESGRCVDLTRRMDEFEQENSTLKEQLREARGRIQDNFRDRMRLERANQELRVLSRSSTSESITPSESFGSLTESDELSSSPTATNGLRQLRLVRSNSAKTPVYSKRSSSLGLQSMLSNDQNKPAVDDSLLLELVNSKTAEAEAKQELEEVRAKFESLRKMVSSQSVANLENRLSMTTLSKSSTEPIKPASPSTNAGGFFSSWGRKVSTTHEFSQ